MTVFPVVLSEHFLLYSTAAGLTLRPVTREHTIGLTTNLIRAVTPNHNANNQDAEMFSRAEGN